jgi:hypothetical protein
LRIRSRGAALVEQRAIGNRDRVDRKTARFKRNGFGRPAVILETVGVERDITVTDAVPDGLAIGSGATAESAGSVVRDIEAAVGDRPGAVAAREGAGQ